MGLLKRFLILVLAACCLFAWGGGLEGTSLWAVRGLVVLAAAAVAVRWTLRPWIELEAAVKRVLGGDFRARLDDMSGGAMGSAARAFNAMAEHQATTLGVAREREERLMAILAASDRGILLLDRSGEVVLSSPVTERLFPKFSPKAGLASLGLPGVSQLAEETFTEGEPKRRLVEEGERGQGRIFAAQAAPVGHGQVVIYLRDVTSEARLERVKADLVANVSHELRTPLTALGSLSEALADPELSQERRADFLSRLGRQVQRMQAIVEDLLSLSRLESSQEQAFVSPVDVSALAAELFLSLQPLAQEARVTLEMDCALKKAIPSDRGLLETVLRNLLENAIRYNKEGGKVVLSARLEEGCAMLSVRDTGEGIPPQHVGRVFERFYRVDPHRSREKGGTGLGLSIVKHGVSKLGGEITVDSTVGVGSTFTIRLPLPPTNEGVA
jgi:two-component system phosphate regulon sensor histidine kinase PhoR